MSMWPGACVIANGSRAYAIASSTVIPQAQNTGTSPGASATGSPKSGRARSRTPMPAGSPTWTGAPCSFGRFAVTRSARSTRSEGIGRMETTTGPRKRPARRHRIRERYIGTPRPCSRWRSGTPARSSSGSNVRLHPTRRVTRSSRHTSTTSARRSTGLPLRHTRYAGRSRRRSAPKARSVVYLPAPTAPSSGQGLGLRTAKRRRSSAYWRGTLTRLACTKPSDQPLVGTASPSLNRARASRGTARA